MSVLDSKGDLERIKQHYSMARDQGVPLGAARLGWLLTSSDSAMAREYFSESADLGEGDGYAGLGWLEEQSDPIDQIRLRKAFQYYMSAEFCLPG